MMGTLVVKWLNSSSQEMKNVEPVIDFLLETYLGIYHTSMIEFFDENS